MNFDFSEDQKFVQHTAREYLSENAGLEVCRAIFESDRNYDEALWKGVAEMGWLGAVIPESYGGAGLGYLELVLIAEEIGASLAPIPFSSSVYLATEAILHHGSDAQKKKYLPRLASGELIGTFALAEGAGDFDPAGVATEISGGKITGTKIAVPDGQTAGLAVVVAKGGLALVDLDGPGVTVTAQGSVDPARPFAQLELSGAPADLLIEGDATAQVNRLLDRAAVLIAFEQVGGATRALHLTRDFAMGRYAFGRPVASFQAIKHKFADLYAAIEIARSSAFYAAWALSEDNDELGTSAASVRAAASDAYSLAGEEMIQIHGGVGFTWEYDCHLFYRRAKALGAVIGSASEWRERLVQKLEAQFAA